MTSLAFPLPLDEHVVLHDVSWEDYERLLEDIGDSATRVTYCDGSMEIMSPLPEHENAADAIGVLIRELTMEMGLPIIGFGSTTYQREDLKKGLEPDKCYYVANEPKVRGMKRFDPTVHSAPDLAIEVDITSRSVPREPVYAALGVPEIWRYKNAGIAIRQLTPSNTYEDSPASFYFPSVPIRTFSRFVQRMPVEEQNGVVREFRQWAGKLPR